MVRPARKSRLLIAVAAVFLCPSLCLADVGVPMVFIGFPFALAGLIPVIAIECLVIRRTLKLDLWSIIKAVAVANLFSMLIGYPIAWILQMALQVLFSLTMAGLGSIWHPEHPGILVEIIGFLFSSAWLIPFEDEFWWMIPAAGMVGLIPAFFLSIKFEAAIEKKFWKAVDAPVLRNAVFRSNVWSYAFLFAVLLFILAKDFRELDPRVWALRKLGVNSSVHGGKMDVNFYRGAAVGEILRGADLTPGVSELYFNAVNVHGQLDGIEKFPDAIQLRFDNTDIQDGDFAALSKLKHVEELWLRGAKIDGSGFELLKDWTALYKIDLSESGLRDENLAHLANFPKLKRLELSHTAITGAGLKDLGDLHELAFLSVDKTGLDDEGAHQLANLKSLEGLVIAETAVGDKGLEGLRGLSKLKHLHMYKTRVTDQGLENLESLFQLEELSIGLKSITDSGLEHLEGLTKLKVIDLNGSSVKGPGLEHLKGLKDLKRLWLQHTSVSPEAVSSLKSALPGVEIFQ